MLKKWVAVIVSFLIITSTVSVLAQDNTKDVQKTEAEIMEEVIAGLENEEEKENVVYIDKDGKVYSNKPGLADGIHPMNIDKEKGSFKLNGIEYAVPQDWLIPDSDSAAIQEIGTGAYRRVKSNSGYRKVEGYVNTTSNFKLNPRVPDGPNTVPYLYLGASSSTGELDAGLLYNLYYQAWTPFIKESGKDLVGYSDDLKIASGKQVFLRFYIEATNRVVLYVAPSGGNAKTFVFDTEKTTWNPNGTGVKMKRLTSFAQNEGHQDFTTGEYFYGSKWLNLYIANTSTMTLWDSSKTSERIAYPNTTVVKINTIHQDYEEAVDIDYR